jgi:hypothetical protein
MRQAGAHQQAAALLARDPAAHATLDNWDAVDKLLDSLQQAGAHQQTAALASRLPAASMFELFLAHKGLADQFRLDGRPMAPRPRNGVGKTWIYG